MTYRPETKDDAVRFLCEEILTEEDQEFIRYSFQDDIKEFLPTLGVKIIEQFELNSDNKKLLIDCCGEQNCNPEKAAFEIIRELWERVQK